MSSHPGMMNGMSNMPGGVPPINGQFAGPGQAPPTNQMPPQPMKQQFAPLNYAQQMPIQSHLQRPPLSNGVVNGSANSSRTGSPLPSTLQNRIPSSQLPPPMNSNPLQNQPPSSQGFTSSQQHLKPVLSNTMNPMSSPLTPAVNSRPVDANSNFTPLKSSTPNLIPNQNSVQSPSHQNVQNNNTIHQLTQGVQGMAVNNQFGQQQQPPKMPPLPQFNGNYANHQPPIPQQPTIPQQPQQQQQFPGIPPQLVQSRYPPMPSTQQPPMPPTSNNQPQIQQMPNQMAFSQPPQQKQPQGVFTGQQSNTLQYQNQRPQYPQQQQQQQQQFPGQQNQQYNPRLSATHQGFNKLWGVETVDLMQNRHVLPTEKVHPPAIQLNHQFFESINCSPDVFRCTLTKIPESKELLNKSRLPLGVLIHPFRDINKLPVIQCTEIVRCRACRTYINPFVYFVDSMKWKCNLCYRVNELPKEFQYDPITKTYGDVTRRPEIKSSTIEFIAPSEYMLRPPQPAIYLFLLDVSTIAVQSGYLNVVCQTITEQLDNLPGDARTQVGFIAYNSAVHFYNIAENFNQPHEITVLDVNDVFLPCPDNLLVNLNECKELLKDLLAQLPKRFNDSHDPKSALGAALQAAYKLMSASGGRVTVFQTCLPNEGPGALQPREDPNNRSSKDVAHLGPATDFYKRFALECSGQQIAVDLFLLNSQYSDMATLSGVSKFSGGSIHHFPLFSHTKAQQVESFKACLERYLTRKIGFEAVMRIRCTRGLTIHTFHGNFFVRSTDLLSLPNVNPDAGFAMQIAHEESLSDLKTVCFQAALLYTSSKGERRIRVHTICLPVVANLSEVILSADTQAIVGLLTKMAVDRSLTSSLTDAREAFINATVDILNAFRLAQNIPQSQVIAPMNLSLLPLYINAILKHIAFRTGTSTRLDDRVFAMCELKTLPLDQLMRYVYPDFYNIDSLFIESSHQNGDDKADDKLEPPRFQLSAEKLDSRSIFLMDTGPQIMVFVGTNVNPVLVKNLFGVSSVNEIPDLCFTLQNLSTPESESLFAFIDFINEEKPYQASVQIIRDTSSYRTQFTEKFVDDRTDNTLSYYEFLQHLRSQVK